MASYLAILLLLLRFSSGALAVSSSYIARSTEQQIIATAPPAAFSDTSDGQSALPPPFLASPSGSFAAYLRRGSSSTDGSGGGDDVCYVEIVQQPAGDGGSSSVWESDCTPVGAADTCDLAFSPMGLELFAGGHSLWDTGVDSSGPALLSLDGAGDLRIVSKDGVTVWRSTGDPFTGQRCGAAVQPSTDVLPPPASSTGAKAKLLAPPVTAASSLAGSSWGSDFSFGDQTAPPLDTDTPPADAYSPDMPSPPPPADPSTDWPDLPLAPPPPADTYPVVPIPESPDQPLFSMPPPPAPAPPTAFVPQTPLSPPPPLATPPAPLVPSPAATSIATPPDSSGSDGTAFLPPPQPPVGAPRHAHQLPLGAASPPVPGAVMAPSGAGHAHGLPFGQGQGQGVFGQQQNQVLNGGAGAGQPLEDSAGGWSSRERRGGAAGMSLALVALMALAVGF